MDSRCRKPIFIISSERSGSNLLRVLLSNHQHIHGPISPHFLETFSGFLKYYTPLNNRDNSERLFDNMLAVANHPYHDWGLSASFDVAWSKGNLQRFFDYFDFFYSEAAFKNNKIRFVSKELCAWKYVFPILDYYKSPKFIYLHRDPRDVVASWMKNPMFLKTPFDAVTSWVSDQEAVNILVSAHGVDMIGISYENLITRTQDTLTRIFEYIQEPVDSACFQTETSQAKGADWNPYWKNLSNPVNPNNSGKYLDLLDFNAIELIETVAKQTMLRLGYEVQTSAFWAKPSFFGIKNRVRGRIAGWRHRRHINDRMERLHSRLALARSLNLDAQKKWEAKKKIE